MQSTKPSLTQRSLSFTSRCPIAYSFTSANRNISASVYTYTSFSNSSSYIDVLVFPTQNRKKEPTWYTQHRLRIFVVPSGVHILEDSHVCMHTAFFEMKFLCAALNKRRFESRSEVIAL